MNRKIIYKIIVLSTLTALAGCGGMQAQPATTASNDAILSATDLQSMIQVTVKQIERIEDPTIVAANEPIK